MQSKSRAMKFLIDIVGEDKYKEEDWIDRKKPEKSLVKICIIQELYLRYFEKEHKDNKRWFLNPGETILTSIDKISKKESTKKL